MDDKNIALLGFISKAADYLKDQIDEEPQEIKEVGEVDLEKIKDELAKRLGSSFDGIKDKKDDLITAGREVFDNFISSNSMIDDFKDIFNVDFKEKNEEKDEHIINHLMEMLNEMPEEDTNEYEKIITKATSDLNLKEAQDKKELEIYKDSKQDKEIDSLFSEIVAHENDGDKKEVAEDTAKEIKEEPLTSSQIKDLVENAVSQALSKFSDQFINQQASQEKKNDFDDLLDELIDEEEFDIDENIDEEPLDEEFEAEETISDLPLEDEIEETISDLPLEDDEEEIDADKILADLLNREKELEESNDYYDSSLEDEKEIKQENNIPSNNYMIGEDGVLRFAEEIEDNNSLETEEQTELEKPQENAEEELPQEEEPLEFEDFLNSSDLPQAQKDEIRSILDSFGDIEIEEELPLKEDIEEPEQEIVIKEEVEDLPENLQDIVEDDTDSLEDTFKKEETPIEETLETEETISEEPLDEEQTQQEDTLSYEDTSYLEDLYNRPIEDIYITNPCADLVIEPEEANEVIDEEQTDNQEDSVNQEDNLNEETLEDTKEDVDEDVENQANYVDDYISSLMNDLSKESPTDKALEEKQKEIDAKNAIYDSIKAIYPYLSDGFIKGVYDLKDSLANEYKDGEDLIILHRLNFSDIEGLRRFVEVIMQHDYLVNVDERQMIVDAFKEHINADGKILTDIFEVANQAKLLTGEYDGYRILRNEEESSL